MTGFDSATAAIASARRAAAADRHSAIHFDVELHPLGQLSGLSEEWRRLASRALEPNIFYEPDFALAAAAPLGADVMAGLVWSQTPRQLAGLFPVRIERVRYGVPFGVLVNWTHGFAPLGTPLVDRDMAELVIAAWLDHVAGAAALPGLMLMQLLPEAGPFAAALAAVLARHDCPMAPFERFERAVALPGHDRAGYLERTMSGTRRRKLRQQKRRLQECGALSLQKATGRCETAAALEDFFKLEAAGWKGRAGTAALNDTQVLHFMQQAVAALAANGTAAVYRLCLEGKAIAATIMLTSGTTAWGWKVAYDEYYAAYSPGVLLIEAITEALLADATIEQIDSCSTGETTVVAPLWSERMKVADWLFSAGPDADVSFALATRLEALRRAAIAAVKSVREQLRG